MILGADGVAEAILNIEGERVALGPLRRDLIQTYLRWDNDFSHRNMGSPGPTTLDQWEKRYEQRAAAEGEIHFTVYERDTLRPIGVTALQGIDMADRTAMFAILIGEPDARGRGYGTETTRLVLDYAFTALSLHSVMLTAYEFNTAGLRAYEKAGFKEFGRRREAHLMDGRWWDAVYMDCLASEFESPVLRRLFSTGAEKHRR